MATIAAGPLRGRLMVGRSALDREVGVRIPAPQPPLELRAARSGQRLAEQADQVLQQLRRNGSGLRCTTSGVPEARRQAAQLPGVRRSPSVDGAPVPRSARAHRSGRPGRASRPLCPRAVDRRLALDEDDEVDTAHRAPHERTLTAAASGPAHEVPATPAAAVPLAPQIPEQGTRFGVVRGTTTDDHGNDG